MNKRAIVTSVFLFGLAFLLAILAVHYNWNNFWKGVICAIGGIPVGIWVGLLIAER